MRLILRRFLIYLFALLQCMAPLLHAHAHAEAHSGVHLPGWSDAHEHGHKTAWVDAHAAGHEAAVGLDLSLQPRTDSGQAMSAPASRLLGTLSTRGPQHPYLASPAVLPGPPPYLTPLPGAPPVV